ncbi:hypothetical protein N7476_004913 [Penicillium atrosanguineum]|uniref:Uncharacterized protein n=1 Tax=Penicillium atrosanguineum TaxID=1132637 RepID=A0A9W9U4R1_9EURO|nr:hypothetical protein N7526_001804 [Penicillium atrosanguineum]KAJ5318234.1 hypothetical protein N7476_004654 [Penicillium atrosanguineum]KAJ5318493.1 hypothetical protein N7476_004913 [Penicillium atrosanguineum]
MKDISEEKPPAYDSEYITVFVSYIICFAGIEIIRMPKERLTNVEPETKSCVYIYTTETKYFSVFFATDMEWTVARAGFTGLDIIINSLIIKEPSSTTTRRQLPRALATKYISTRGMLNFTMSKRRYRVPDVQRAKMSQVTITPQRPDANYFNMNRNLI